MFTKLCTIPLDSQVLLSPWMNVGGTPGSWVVFAGMFVSPSLNHMGDALNELGAWKH